MATTETPTTHNASRKALALPLTVAAAVLLVVGLVGGYFIGHNSDDNSAASPTLSSLASRASATAHNDADVTLAQDMVPHHTQALVMAKLADTRAGSADVKTLAATIEAAQQPEIDTMNGWLTAWGADSGQSSSSTGTSNGSMGMSDGMMSQSDMDQLATLSGAAFDKQFLTMMIGHHQGAITMAQDELENGQNADALALASSITLTQQAQVDQMRGMLAQ